MSVLSDQLQEQLISVCRTAIGDDLRSITYFTLDDHEQIYLRSDLDLDADLDRFVDNERLGFQSQATYGDSELGEYQYTIRVFEFGYITRTIVDDHGVFVTTDPLHMDDFDEIERSIHTVMTNL